MLLAGVPRDVSRMCVEMVLIMAFGLWTSALGLSVWEIRE